MTDVFVEGRAESNDLVLPDAHLDDWIEGLPGSSATSFAGVANPFHWGLPQQGEHVVDVGSGAGMDCLVAARAVGPEGRVVGVDMTPAMLERSRTSAAEAGLANSSSGRGWPSPSRSPTGGPTSSSPTA